jgi:ADP-glucose pyrophosphorylase
VAEQTAGFGILRMNAQGRITHFEEKPWPERLPDLVSEIPGAGPGYLASMGIYVLRARRAGAGGGRAEPRWTSAAT